MKKQTRKEALRQRGFAYEAAHRPKDDGAGRYSAFTYYAWQDGYRAAMRDLRKSLRNRTDMTSGETVLRFLRPIR